LKALRPPANQQQILQSFYYSTTMDQTNNNSENDVGQSQPQKKLQALVLTTIAVVAVCLFLSVVSESESFTASLEGFGATSVGGSNSSVRSSSLGKKAHQLCSSVCSQRRQKRFGSIEGSPNLVDTLELVEQVSNAKETLLNNLKTDYGEHFEPIFVDEETGGYRPFKPMNDVSMERLKRKLMIKVLSMKSTFYEQDSDFYGCDCRFGSDSALRNDVTESLNSENVSVIFEGIDDDDDADKFFEKYVWANGGHSASAGHGNLFNESYTAYMENDLKGIFGSIGIDFEGRNYAMGGQSSATTISMCWKEIFGEDPDFFTWDYGMTDGNEYSLLEHYMWRGAMLLSRPATMLIHHGGRSGKSRQNIMRSLEANGLAAFYDDEVSQRIMKENIPDSAGLSADEIAAMPEYVRNYKCGTAVEKGDPYCSSSKYTKWGCTKRLKQASWHPGFKEHALIGHGLGLFFTDVLLGALRDLSSLEVNNTDAMQLLSRLRKEDIELHNYFTAAPIPSGHLKLFDLSKVKTRDGEPTINASTFFKGPSMCHTGRVPSQIRYNGILTDTDMVGGPAPYKEETYFVGINKEEAKKTPSSDSDELRLVFEVSKERQEKCDGFTVKPDYPDTFMVTSNDSWAKLMFPNDAEKRFYRYDPKDYQGILLFHVKVCDWGKCPKGFLEEQDKGWEMKVNGQKIKKVISMGKNSGSILQGENGFHFEPDENGQYMIELKVTKKDYYLEIADFVLY